MIILPLNDCLQKHNFEFFTLNSTTSTMDEAKSRVDSINKNLILLANKQTRGRGRRGNKWVSPSGNIYCSIALTENLPKNDFLKFGMLVSVAVKHSLEHIGLVDIFFKWPNDIYCHNKKISGVMQEVYLNKFEKKTLIIGVGINFSSSPKKITYQTTHINEYVENISREKYFEIFINYFLYYFNEFFFNKDIDFIFEYKKIQMFLNTNIKIKVDENKIIKGQFLGINEDGSLILVKNKQKLSIYSGQIQV